MARGMWRSWVVKNGADVWSARIEIARGEWADATQAEYEAAGHAPPFWDLPLQEDYVADTLRDPIIDEELRIRREVEEPGLMAIAALGGALVVVFVVGYMLLVKFGMLG